MSCPKGTHFVREGICEACYSHTDLFRLAHDGNGAELCADCHHRCEEQDRLRLQRMRTFRAMILRIADTGSRHGNLDPIINGRPVSEILPELDREIAEAEEQLS